ncbi:hypothetical protein L7F22_044691 [Adiantum nelumboides]|nr:hypothetical protein [Adiantum nelumboides]
METGLKLSLHDARDSADVNLYQTTIGCLIYVCNIRPDIQFAISQVSRFMHSLGSKHWQAIKRIFCYLNGTLHLGLFYSKAPDHCCQTYMIFQTQIGLVVLTHEAVFTAMVECVWLRRLMVDLGVGQDTANTIYTDSQSALAIARNPFFHARTKHIEVHYYYVKERLSVGEISLAYVPTQDNLADLFTKALSREKLEAFHKALGLLPFVD